MSRRKVVALAGLSGVGKSTLLENAQRTLVFEHLQASELIKAERRECQRKPVAHDLLREGNIDDNQALLISGFMRRAPKEGLIVLDGHTVIDTPDGLVEILPSVFRRLMFPASLSWSMTLKRSRCDVYRIPEERDPSDHTRSSLNIRKCRYLRPIVRHSPSVSLCSLSP